jgi:VIT1/CCC1 family predicted Fe2+/Mn2+ transporter
MCDNTSVISVAKNLVFYKRMRHLERRHHFIRDHVEKRDIEMRYIDTERQLTDIFTKPFNSSHFAALRGKIDALSYILVSFTFLLYFLYTHLSHFASPVILACICLIILITVLG